MIPENLLALARATPGEQFVLTGAKPRRGDLIHYSDAPLASVRTEPQTVHAAGEFRSKYAKPKGLWVSVLGPRDWRWWCAAEHFREVRAQYATRIVLHPDARILRLRGEIDLDVFTRDYGEDVVWGERRWTDRVICWDRVAADWQGIVIAPYVWSRRLHDTTGWYYVWDCASGCIWNADAVERVEPLRAARAYAASVKEKQP